MTRDDGWRFLSLGRHLERLRFVATHASTTSRSAQAAADSAMLEWLLELSDSLLTYRVRHMQQPEWESVVDLMVFDERNPRSARFQLAKLAKHVRLLPDADLIDVVREIDRAVAAAARRTRSRASCSTRTIDRRSAQRLREAGRARVGRL